MAAIIARCSSAGARDVRGDVNGFFEERSMSRIRFVEDRQHPQAASLEYSLDGVLAPVDIALDRDPLVRGIRVARTSLRRSSPRRRSNASTNRPGSSTRITPRLPDSAGAFTTHGYSISSARLPGSVDRATVRAAGDGQTLRRPPGLAHLLLFAPRRMARASAASPRSWLARPPDGLARLGQVDRVAGVLEDVGERLGRAGSPGPSRSRARSTLLPDEPRHLDRAHELRVGDEPGSAAGARASSWSAISCTLTPGARSRRCRPRPARRARRAAR